MGGKPQHFVARIIIIGKHSASLLNSYIIYPIIPQGSPMATSLPVKPLRAPIPRVSGKSVLHLELGVHSQENSR